MCYGASSSTSSSPEKRPKDKDSNINNSNDNNNKATMEDDHNITAAATSTSNGLELIDPYHSLAPSPILPDAIQDLLAVDVFIDSCGAKHKKADIMEDLRAVDVEIDSAQRITKVKTSDEGAILMDLVATDNLVDGRKGGNHGVESLVDPYRHTKPSTKHGASTASPEARAEYEKNMSYLLATDELIDQTKYSTTGNEEYHHQLLMDLLQTDLEMQTSTKKKTPAFEDPMEEMLRVDQMIDQIATSSYTQSTPAAAATTAAVSTSGLTGIYAELYQVDQMIDGCSKKNEEHHDVEAIMDLLHVDQLIDGHKQKQSIDVYSELRGIDLLVDGKKKSDHNAEQFIDPITKATMKQYQVTSASKPFTTQGMNEISDLLKVDQEIDNAKKCQDDGIRPLLEVDRLIDGNQQKKKDDMDLEDVKDLLAVDREIDQAVAATSQKESKQTPRFHCNHHHGHELTEAYAELYAIDHQIDHGRLAQKRHDDMSSLMELVATDKLVDGCKISRADDAIADIYQALLAVDRTIDGRGKGDNEDKNVKFIDPMVELSVRQYEARCHSAKLMEEEGLLDVVDLLATDLEIDGHKSYEAQMKGVLPLLEVDRLVDGWKETRNEANEMEQIKALLEVDREVDGARSAMEAKKQQKMGEMDGVMLDLLRVDLEVDGARGHWERKHNLEDIQELLAVDLLVDASKDTKKKKTIDEVINASVANLPPHPPPPQHSLQDVQDLLEVDKFVDGRKHKIATNVDLGELSDLYKVDREIDAARAAAILVSGIRPSTSNSNVGRLAMDKQRRVSMANPEDSEAEKLADTAGAAAPALTYGTQKRSIFTAREKQSVTKKCVIAPGTTAVVSTRSPKIDDIPIGRTIPTAEANINTNVGAKNPYMTATTSVKRGVGRRRSSRNFHREKSDKCAIM